MYKIKQSVGYIFEKRKLIITIPVGYLNVEKENIEKELEVIDFGPYASLPSDAMIIADYNYEFISQSFREKAVEKIIVIDEITDLNTGNILENECKRIKENYNSELSYLQQGYELKSVFEFNECKDKYLIKEDFEHCTILNIEASKFDLKKLLMKSNKSIRNIDSFNKVVKSKSVNHIFVSECMKSKNIDIDDIVKDILNNNVLISVPYLYLDENSNFRFKSLDESINLLEADFEDEEEVTRLFGDIVINPETIVSYLISCNNGIINVKIMYFRGITQGYDKLYEIVENIGQIKEMMFNHLNEYIL